MPLEHKAQPTKAERAELERVVEALARVETHRLRKRLTTFYETEGKDHPIQMNIPAGSYIPVFVHKPEQIALPPSPGPAPALAPLPPASESNLHLKGRPAQWIRRSWRYFLVGACLVLVAVGAY